ncbi:hypothetical protein Tco_0789733 [Tanacetum coccineum]
MRIDKLHKFSDGMLSYVRTAIHDITSGIRMEYIPKRKWSGLDKQRARVIIQDIDKQLFQRRLMQNLEKFVGGREYREDLRLHTKGPPNMTPPLLFLLTFQEASQGYLDIGKLNTNWRLNREDSNLLVHSYRVVCFETLR